jgi:hypothetical protein
MTTPATPDNHARRRTAPAVIAQAPPRFRHLPPSRQPAGVSRAPEKRTTEQRLRDFVALVMAGVALVALPFDLVRKVTPGEAAFFMVMIGFPVLIAGIMLAIRYRRDIRAHPWHIVAGAGAGAVGYYYFSFLFIFENRKYLEGPYSSTGDFILDIVIRSLAYIFLWPFVLWIYRHALHAITYRNPDRTMPLPGNQVTPDDVR